MNSRPGTGRRDPVVLISDIYGMESVLVLLLALVLLLGWIVALCGAATSVKGGAEIPTKGGKRKPAGAVVPLDYSKFETTPETSRYSLSPWHSLQFVEAFRVAFRTLGVRPDTLWDLTAHVGVEAITLAKAFGLSGRVFEVNPVYCCCLRKNVERFGVDLKVVCGSSVLHMRHLDPAGLV